MDKQIGICERCGKERIIYLQSKCKYCYNLQYLNLEKHRLNCKKWRESHPNYYKEYYAKHPDKYNKKVMKDVVTS